ncbi:MAG: Branched-chain amino acid transporter, amino acid-binding protein [Nocardioidaceae bacterium]|nr:Branched-chain amino acid transporter, amino acid-binding protein [Nocardioidaceae bacterium]
MSLGLSRRATALSALALGALAAPMLIAGAASAAPQPGFGCANNDVSGTTITLTSDCYLASTLTVPDGFTLDGNGHTINAVEITENGNTFPTAVVQSASGAGGASAVATLNVRNLNIVGRFGTNADTNVYGINFENAGGSLTNVSVVGITHGIGGQTNRAVRVNNAGTTRANLAISGLKIRNFSKSGLYVNGPVDVNATGMDIGYAASPDGTQLTTVAANSVSLLNGASGSIANSTIAGNRYSTDNTGGPNDALAAAILLIDPGTVTVSGTTITGQDSDVGVYVSNDVTTRTATVKVTCTSLKRTAGGDADPTYGQAILNDGGAGQIALTVGSNSYSGWTTNVDGASTATVDPTCPVVAPVTPAVATVAVTTNKPKPRKGKKFTISGSANPALAGVSVTLQRKFGKEYRAVASGTLPANGAISFTKKTNKRGNKFYRVVVGSGPAYAGGTSNVVKIHTR